MKKNFPLAVSGNPLPRVIDAIKSDVRKYLKRERRKTLPEGVDFWDFDCRVGANETEASPVHVAEINTAIESAALAATDSIYVEILAKAATRSAKPKVAEDEPIAVEADAAEAIEDTEAGDEIEPETT